MHMFSLIPPLLVPHMQLRIPPDSSPTQRPMIGSPSTSHWTFFFFFWVTAGGDAELTKVCLALLSRVFQILDRLCGKRSRLEHGLPKQTLLASVPILITIVSEAEVMWFLEGQRSLFVCFVLFSSFGKTAPGTDPILFSKDLNDNTSGIQSWGKADVFWKAYFCRY